MGLPWLTPVVFDSALIYLDIYFINVVNPIAEKVVQKFQATKKCRSAVGSVFIVTISKRKQRQIGILTSYHVLALLM